MADFSQMNMGIAIGSAVVGIAFFLLTLVASVGILVAYVKKEKFSFSDTLKGARAYYFRYLLLMILLGVIFVLPFVISAAVLFVAPILSAVLFIASFVFLVLMMVYWMFAGYVLVDEDEKVVRSLVKSRRIIKGSWWRVLGNWIIVMLIFFVIGLIFEIPAIPTGIMAAKEGASQGILIFHFVLSGLLGAAGRFITIPLGVMFFKNLYSDIKEQKGKKKKKR
jgi:hypothetical protein